MVSAAAAVIVDRYRLLCKMMRAAASNWRNNLNVIVVLCLLFHALSLHCYCNIAFIEESEYYCSSESSSNRFNTIIILGFLLPY